MKRLAVIGDPIEHSLSPVMHNAALKAIGLSPEYLYEKIRVTTAALEEFMADTDIHQIVGLNITAPHKMAIIKHLDIVSDEVQLSGSCNTAVKKDGKWYGYTTDGYGVLRSFKENDVNLTGKLITLLGAGGAGRTIAFALGKENLGHIHILNRTLEKARQLAQELRDHTSVPVDFGKLSELSVLEESDVIINATTTGDLEQPVIDMTILKPEQVVMDIVYRVDHDTSLIASAKAYGCTTISGLEMLLYQGVRGFELFTERDAPIPIMRKALEEAVLQ